MQVAQGQSWRKPMTQSYGSKIAAAIMIARSPKNAMSIFIQADDHGSSAFILDALPHAIGPRLTMYESELQRAHNTRICFLRVAIGLVLLAICSGSLLRLSDYIVRANSADQAAALVEAAGGSVTRPLAIIDSVVARLPDSTARRLVHSPSIVHIHANAQVHAAAGGNVSDTNFPEVVGADVVWNAGVTGEGIAVAIVDTGIAQHKALTKYPDGSSGRIVGWVDFVESAKHPIDPSGHGSHIAGIIAGSQLAPDGSWTGVAPGVNLVGVRVLDENGGGTYADVISGIQWVVEHADTFNIRLLNLSLVSTVQAPYWADPLNQAVMEAWAAGITVVVAAGNQGPDPMSIGVPGNTPYVVTVGAFTDNYTPLNWNDDFIAPFSAAGPTLDGFVKPDLVAPGGHIISSMKSNAQLVDDGIAHKITPKYASMAGTSQATAVVTGIAALMLEQHAGLTPDAVKYRLMHSAFPWIDLETTDALYSIWQQGAGRINAPGAVFDELSGLANAGMDIHADLAGTVSYEGYSYYDEAAGEFRLIGEFNDWAGGYGNWAGGYGNWAGGYGNWAGGYGNWAGAYGNWAGGYGNWAGAYGNWAGSYGNWAGGYGNWAGGYGNWAGGYGNWAGGYGNWAGSYGDPIFAAVFVNWDGSSIAEAWLTQQTLLSVTADDS
jgi:subtilisin family serine protease